MVCGLRLIWHVECPHSLPPPPPPTYAEWAAVKSNEEDGKGRRCRVRNIDSIARLVPFDPREGGERATQFAPAALAGGGR